MGGVGKTTACKIVANDQGVRSKFKDGVFWMEFGMGKTAEAALGDLGRSMFNMLRMKIILAEGGQALECVQNGNNYRMHYSVRITKVTM